MTRATTTRRALFKAASIACVAFAVPAIAASTIYVDRTAWNAALYQSDKANDAVSSQATRTVGSSARQRATAFHMSRPGPPPTRAQRSPF